MSSQQIPSRLFLRLVTAWTAALLCAQPALAQRLASHTCGDISSGSGQQNRDEYGQSFAAADFNGDGLVDVAVGAPYWDDSGTSAVYGAVYVLWGPVIEEQKKSLAFFNTLDPDLHTQTGQQVGQALAVVNGFTDGHPTLLLVGAPFADDVNPLVSDRGRVDMYEYVQSQWVFRAKFRPYDDFTNGFFGSDIAGIGDFNRDDHTDFAVGTRNQRVDIFFGGITLQATSEIGPDIQIQVASGTFGRAVFGGDIDGNGFGDIIVADPNFSSNSGRAWVFLDREITGQLPLEWDETDADFTITGESSDFLGRSIAAGSDVTGDAEPDLVLAAPATGTSGELLIYEGPLSAPGGDNDYSPSDADGRITGFDAMLEAFNQGFPGEGMSAAADVLGSAAHEIVVAQGNSSGLLERLILLEGGSHLLSASPQSLSSLGDHVRRIEATAATDDRFGDAVLLTAGGPAGINGRIFVGAPHDNAGANGQTGYVHVYELRADRVAFRQRGGDAYGQGLQYSGTPRAAITLDYDAGEEEENLFVSIAGTSNNGVLYRVHKPDVDTGIAGFTDMNSTQIGFVSNDDLPGPDQRGAAAADLEGDGDIDFFVSAPAGTEPDEGARLYRYDESVGKYEDIADDILIRGTGVSFKELAALGLAASWADYDLDGQVDLLLTRDGSSLQTPLLLKSHFVEDGDFEDVSAALGLTADGGMECWAHAWGDYDDDGDPDLFLGQEDVSGPLSRLYRNDVPNGSGFSEVLASLTGAESAGLEEQLSGDRSAAWADLDRDGRLDLILAKTDETSKYAFLRNTGTALEASKIPVADGGALVIRPIDYDFDGTLELLTMQHDVSDKFRVLRRIGDCTGTAFFTDDAVDAAVDEVAGGTPYILAGDFAGSGNHDGDIDLLLGTDLSQGATSATALLQSLTLDDGQAIGDIPGTTLDIGPSKHWIGFVLRGNGGTPSASIGAKITIEYDSAEGTVVQTQQVDGGSMRASQGSPVLRFGLDTYSGGYVDTQIEWPDGFVGTYSGFAVDAIHEHWEDALPAPTKASASIQLLPDGVRKITFIWETTYATYRKTSGVEIRRVTGSGCATGELHDGESHIGGEVQYAMVPVYAAGKICKYAHTLIWTTSCDFVCNYEWRVISSTLNASGSDEVYSSWKSVGSFLCIAE